MLFYKAIHFWWTMSSIVLAFVLHSFFLSLTVDNINQCRSVAVFIVYYSTVFSVWNGLFCNVLWVKLVELKKRGATWLYNWFYNECSFCSRKHIAIKNYVKILNWHIICIDCCIVFFCFFVIAVVVLHTCTYAVSTIYNIYIIGLVLSFINHVQISCGGLIHTCFTPCI